MPVSANLAYAVFLLLLAAAIGARKKVAWWLVVIYLGLLFLLDVLLISVTEWAWIPNGVFCALVLAVLILARKQFYAQTRKGAFRRAVGVLCLGLAAGVLVGWGLVELFPDTLPRGQRLLWATNRVFGGLASSGQFDGSPPRPLYFLLGLFGAIALLTAASTLFRSQRMEAALHGDEEPRIRALLGAYGRQDSLGYFATRRDKAVVFSPNGKAAVTYRVEAGVALASGDPVGDTGAWGPAIDAWLDIARKYAWAPAVMGASEDGATAYARHGLGAIQLGDEAILNVAKFDLDGRDMRVTRQAVRRVARTGATTRVRRHSALTDEEMQQIIDRADAWRDTETERGFSMALDRLGDPADGDCLLVEAFDADGASDRAALLRALGQRRHLARPDAARPQRAQRRHGVHGRRTVRHRTEVGRAPDLAQLRGVPLGLRGGRPHRRRPRTAAVAPAAALLLQVVAARSPLPLQREVPAAVVPALPLLRRRGLARPRRPRLRHRRGLRLRTEPAQALGQGPATGGVTKPVTTDGLPSIEALGLAGPGTPR